MGKDEIVGRGGGSMGEMEDGVVGEGEG